MRPVHLATSLARSHSFTAVANLGSRTVKYWAP